MTIMASIRRRFPLKTVLSFLGPAFLVTVGFIDPGNWATNIEGGSRFGYQLLWVITFSTVILIIIQHMAAKLGVATGKSLAVNVRERFAAPVVGFLGLTIVLACVATDVAELLGGAIGFRLLLGLPLWLGALVMVRLCSKPPSGLWAGRDNGGCFGTPVRRLAMRYIGLDVHYRSSTYCVLAENGQEVQCETVRGHWPQLLDRLRTVAGPWTVCFEATCGYGYLYRELSRLAQRVVVAHPGQLRLIFRAKRKNDRIDARKLAKLLYLDEVPAAYVPRQEVQSWRELIEHRRRMVDRQTTCKNAIRSLLRAYGKIAPQGLWTKKGLAWLRQEEMPTAAARLKRDLLLDELTEAKQRVRTVTKALDAIGACHPAVLLLRTIPGVGIRTAETVAAYIDNARRFVHGAQVGAYFGLVPCQDASAGVNRLGHITRQGPATARKYLVEAAWQGVYRSPTIRAYFERVQHGRPERRKVALVATAHYLLRCMHAMLVHNQPWHEAA